MGNGIHGWKPPTSEMLSGMLMVRSTTSVHLDFWVAGGLAESKPGDESGVSPMVCEFMYSVLFALLDTFVCL